MDTEKALAFAKSLADEAGKIMRQYFRADDIGTEWKDDQTPLTVADTTINQLVIDRVKDFNSEHGVLGEEDSYKLDADFLWVVDPIDGTAMYDAGVPIATFSLALVDHKGDGQPVVAVVYDPFSERLWSAVAGKGAYMNDDQIHVGKATELSRKTLVEVTGLTYTTEKHVMKPVEIISKLAEDNTRTTVHQSAVFTGCLVATGDYAAIILNIKTTYDAPAAALIVQEAGGVATDLFGNPQRYDVPAKGAIMANPTLHKKIVDLLNS
jgi:myo-inositol-1(or 4)-monophosphatase